MLARNSTFRSFTSTWVKQNWKSGPTWYLLSDIDQALSLVWAWVIKKSWTFGIQQKMYLLRRNSVASKVSSDDMRFVLILGFRRDHQLLATFSIPTICTDQWCSATAEIRICKKNVHFNKDSTLNLAILANSDMTQRLVQIVSFEVHRCRKSCFNKSSSNKSTKGW